MPAVRLPLCIVAAAGFVLASLVPVAAQPARAMDPAAFAEELQRLSTAISSGAPDVIPNVRVPTVWAVETGQQRFEMPAGWLRLEIDLARRNPSSWPSRRATLLGRLDAMRIEAESLAAVTAAPRQPELDVARTALDRVLAAPEFAEMAQQSALTRLRQRFTAWLRDMWGRLGGNALGSRGTALVFAWTAALLALAVLSAWLIRLLRQPTGRLSLTLEAPAPGQRSARAWARAALEAADPREAARCAYRAVVYRFEEDGAWPPDDTRTPREYLRLLPRDDRRRGLLSDVTRRFEEIWYGARQATDDDRRLLLVHLKALGCLPAD